MAAEPSAEAARARAELAAALDAIEERLNVPRRVKRRVRELRATQPAVFVGAAASAAALAGGAVWLIIRGVRR